MFVIRGSVSMVNLDTVTVSLSTPVPVGSSFAMVTNNFNASSLAQNYTTAELKTVVSGNYTELEIKRTSTAVTGNTVEWQIIYGSEFTVQMGTTSLTSAGSASVTAAISAVTLSRAFIVSTFRTNAAHLNGTGIANLKFDSTTQISINRGANGSNATYVWYVVEWAGATVQSDTITTSSSWTSQTDAVSAVTLAETFLLYTYTNSSTGILRGDAALVRGRITSTTELTFNRNTGSGITHTITWFAISHPDITTQTGTVSLSSGSTTATISSKPTNQTAIIVPQVGNQTSNDGSSEYERWYTTYRVTDATTLTFTKTDTSGTVNIAYFTVTGDPINASGNNDFEVYQPIFFANASAQGASGSAGFEVYQPFFAPVTATVRQTSQWANPIKPSTAWVNTNKI